MKLLDRSIAAALRAALWLLGALPAPVRSALAAALAGVYRWLHLREARVARRNLELCFPELSPPARAALLRACLRHTALTLLECARLWTRPTAANLRRVRTVHGGQLLDAALAAPTGVIIAAPHLGNWELLNQYLASRTPLAIVYKAPGSDALEAVLRRGRGADGVTQVRAEAAAVRTLVRVLHGRGVVGILPDQQPRVGDGEFAPFFGVPALTMTLLPRLATRTGATVLFAYALRRPGGDGFEVHFRAAPEGIADPDPLRATAALNRGIEDCTRDAPEQYQWTYKRFSIKPPGSASRYPRPGVTDAAPPRPVSEPHGEKR